MKKWFCLLRRLFQLLKDFCGVVNEASLKVNIVLVYEVLEEVLVSYELIQTGLFFKPKNVLSIH